MYIYIQLNIQIAESCTFIERKTDATVHQHFLCLTASTTIQ